jgi:hypothetical protein
VLLPCALRHRDESRSWHLDLTGERGRPWSIDLVVVLLMGFRLRLREHC